MMTTNKVMQDAADGTRKIQKTFENHGDEINYKEANELYWDNYRSGGTMANLGDFGELSKRRRVSKKAPKKKSKAKAKPAMKATKKKRATKKK